MRLWWQTPTTSLGALLIAHRSLPLPVIQARRRLDGFPPPSGRFPYLGMAVYERAMTLRSDHTQRTFGRRNARPLTARQKRLLEELLPRLSVPETRPGALDPLALFGAAEEAWLEIGFGGGEHLVAQAGRTPAAGLIGCEPFIDGMAKALAQIEDAGPANIRLHMGDAREVMAWLKPASISRVFILFPDPWPKARHHKRRLIQPAFLDELARITAPGARIRFATDVASYADQALVRFLRDGRFDWTARRADDWRTPPADHIRTRYETKALGDVAPVYFDFVRAV